MPSCLSQALHSCGAYTHVGKTPTHCGGLNEYASMGSHTECLVPT